MHYRETERLKAMREFLDRQKKLTKQEAIESPKRTGVVDENGKPKNKL